MHEAVTFAVPAALSRDEKLRHTGACTHRGTHEDPSPVYRSQQVLSGLPVKASRRASGPQTCSRAHSEEASASAEIVRPPRCRRADGTELARLTGGLLGVP